jgi:hypothetical protein
VSTIYRKLNKGTSVRYDEGGIPSSLVMRQRPDSEPSTGEDAFGDDSQSAASFGAHPVLHQWEK